MKCIALLLTIVTNCTCSYKLTTSIITMSYLRVLLYSIVDTNVIDLTQESDCNHEADDLDYDANVSEKSCNADVALVTSSEDMSTDDDSSR